MLTLELFFTWSQCFINKCYHSSREALKSLPQQTSLYVHHQEFNGCHPENRNTRQKPKQTFMSPEKRANEGFSGICQQFSSYPPSANTLLYILQGREIPIIFTIQFIKLPSKKLMALVAWIFPRRVRILQRARQSLLCPANRDL